MKLSRLQSEVKSEALDDSRELIFCINDKIYTAKTVYLSLTAKRCYCLSIVGAEELPIKEDTTDNKDDQSYSSMFTLDQENDSQQDTISFSTDEDEQFIPLDNSTSTITSSSKANINIQAFNSTVNIYNGGHKKKSKQEKIKENLFQLAKLGFDFERLSDFSVRIHTPRQDIDFFLTTERFMPVGGTTAGQGFSELVKYIEGL